MPLFFYAGNVPDEKHLPVIGYVITCTNTSIIGLKCKRICKCS